MQRMSDSEKKIMEYIWAAGHPVTTSEIIKNLPEAAEWKQNTVITFLTRLIRKKILKATRVGKANQYEPCITAEEYRNFEIKQFIKDVHKGSILGFISSLCDNGDITMGDIESLMKRFKK